MWSIVSYIILLSISACSIQPQFTDFSTEAIVSVGITTDRNAHTSISPESTGAHSTPTPFVSAGTSHVQYSSSIPIQGTGPSSEFALSTQSASMMSAAPPNTMQGTGAPTQFVLSTQSASMMSDASASSQTNPFSTSSTVQTTSTTTNPPTTTFLAGIAKIFRSFSKICASCSGQYQWYVWIRCAKCFCLRRDHQQ